MGILGSILFQFQMVRLKAVWRAEDAGNADDVSIPNGTIKSYRDNRNNPYYLKFQFQMVRLKVFAVTETTDKI